MLKIIGVVGLGLGILDSGLARVFIDRFPSVFTPDQAVWKEMLAISPLCGLTLILHAFTMGLHVRLIHVLARRLTTAW